MALCHSDPVFNTGEESNHINVPQIPHFVQDDKLGLFTNPPLFRYSNVSSIIPAFHSSVSFLSVPPTLFRE
jgi:hypothetical protein